MELYDQYFKIEDGAVIFKGTKLIIQVPQSFIDDGITVIEQTDITTLGIFDGYIFEDVEGSDLEKADHHFVMKLPAKLFMKPSHIDVQDIMVEDTVNDTVSKEKFYNFIFLTGDTFMVSTSLVKQFGIVDNFMRMMLNGKMPKAIRYDEIASMWSECAFLNGSGALKSNYSTLATIVSNLVRDPKDYSKPFRYNAESYYAQRVYNGKVIRYMDIPRYISNFTAITGSDPRHSVTVAMERIHGEKQKDVFSPVEQNIL